MKKIISGIIPSVQNYSLETTQEIVNSITFDALRTDQPVKTDKKIIGLKKDFTKEYYITTNKSDMIEVSKWADYVAIDSRIGNREKEFLYAVAHTMDIKIVADIEKLIDVESVIDMCKSLKIQAPKYFATTFSKMNINLIRQIKITTNIPVIAEGGYRYDYDIQEVKEAGACAVCIGAAMDIRELSKEYVNFWDRLCL